LVSFFILGANDGFLVSDRFVIQTVQNSTRLQETVDILPNKTEGIGFIRLGVLSGNRTKPAGIPLDQAGIRHSDQVAKGCFQDFPNVPCHATKGNHENRDEVGNVVKRRHEPISPSPPRIRRAEILDAR